MHLDMLMGDPKYLPSAERYSFAFSRKAVQAVGMDNITEKQFNFEGVILNYVAGPDNGPPIVLIPAQMGTWESYRKVIPELSTHFQVYAVDIRGHGKSSWTTGNYSWNSIGKDMTAFLKEVVKRPAVIAGNSSGGIIALWLAANVPEHVAAIVLEDAPLFSVEMPRFKEQDKYVYQGLEHLVRTIGDVQHRNLADYFRELELPLKNRRVKRIPNWMVNILSYFINRYQKEHPGEPVDIPYFPSTLRLLFKSLSQFDPDFARAFVDGRFYEGFSHEAALKKVECPMLILHADWFRHPKRGLVGALNDDDIAHAKSIKPDLHYRKIAANHVIHVFKPREYLEAISTFLSQIGYPSEVVRQTVQSGLQ